MRLLQTAYLMERYGLRLTVEQLYYRKIGRWRIQTRPVRWKAEGPPESPPAGQCAARP